MKIAERITELQKMVNEQSGQLAITLPTHSVETLFRYCADRAELQKKYTRERTRANYYQEAYESAKAEIKRSKQRVV